MGRGVSWPMSATWTPWRIMPSICWAMNPLCGPWENGHALRPRQNIVPVKLFRFTKTFTERCWSNRRSRHEFFGIRQNRQPQPDQRAPTFAVLDDHLRRVAIEYFQTFGDIRHADAAAPKAIGLLQQLSG